MARIFLSYSREDRASAERLARIMESAGHDVWWDRHLDSGEEFAAEIEAELDKADVVLVAWSATSVKSRWVRDEAAVGGDTDRLVPVSIDGTLPPMGFRQFHTLDLAGWKGSKRDERTVELLHSIDRRLKQRSVSSQDAAAQAKDLRSPKRDRRRIAIAAAVAVAIIVAVGLIFVANPRWRKRPHSAPTIALLPFTATSSDPAVRKLALDAHDSVAHDFADSGIPLKLVDSPPSASANPIADYLMSAEFSSDQNKVTATVQLQDAAQHVSVWSRRIEADRQHAADLADRVGAQVAGSITWTGVVQALDPADPQFTARYLQIDITRDPLQNYENAQRLAAQAPSSGMAQIALAMFTAFALDALPREQRGPAISAARRAAGRGRSLSPNFGDAYIPSCLLQPDVEIAACEDNLRAGLKTDPDAPFVNQFLAYVLYDVGRDQDALDRTNLSYQHDPYMPAKISQMLKMMEMSGEARDADSLYSQGVRWWPEWGLFRARMAGILARGDFDALRRATTEPGAEAFAAGRAIDTAVGAIDGHSVPQLRQACVNAQNGLFLSVTCMLGFAKLSDQDDAYKIADQLYPRRMGRTPAESERIWLDNPDSQPLEFITSAAAAPLRRDPRFLALAKRTGLLAYWRSGRPPDFCRQKPEPECGALLHDK